MGRLKLFFFGGEILNIMTCIAGIHTNKNVSARLENVLLKCKFTYSFTVNESTKCVVIRAVTHAGMTGENWTNMMIETIRD